MTPCRTVIILLIWILLLLGPQRAFGLIFFHTGDLAHNREVAPVGAPAGAGWQYQGYFKSYLGTMISPRHFVTAAHVGLGVNATSFLHKSFFSGEATDRTYFINPNANGGTGFWDIAGTDFRIFEVYGDFPDYAELYAKSDEPGKQAVIMGRGRPRGDAVTKSGQTRGWLWGANDTRARWGVNTIDSIDSSALGEVLVTDFDAAPGTDECQASAGDSGGAFFLEDDAVWKLAGITYAVDRRYDTNDLCGDSSHFDAALFDASGFYAGKDTASCDGWTVVAEGGEDQSSRTYASRISASASAIQVIIQPAIDDAAKTPRRRFDEWMGEFGAAGGLPGEDHDGDCWANAVEYLAALDPGAGNEPGRPFAVEVRGDKIRFTVRIRLDAAARGLSWEIQGSADPARQAYAAVEGLSEVVVTRSLEEGVETVEYEIERPAARRMFYRLAVSLGP